MRVRSATAEALGPCIPGECSDKAGGGKESETTRIRMAPSSSAIFAATAPAGRTATGVVVGARDAAGRTPWQWVARNHIGAVLLPVAGLAMDEKTTL